MRSTTRLAALSIPLLLIACNDRPSPITGPETPELAAAARRARLDPGHTYRFDFTCGSGARLADIDRGRGDLTATLDPYTPQANERMMLTAFAKSPQFGWSPEMARAEAQRIETTRRCTRTG